MGLPRWPSGKEPTCQCRGCRFDPWVGKICWRRKWRPIPVFLPGKSHGQGNLADSPWGCRVRQDLVTEHTHTHTPHTYISTFYTWRHWDSETLTTQFGDFCFTSVVNVLTSDCWHELYVTRDNTINAWALEPGHVGSDWLHHLVDHNFGQEAKLVNIKQVHKYKAGRTGPDGHIENAQSCWLFILSSFILIPVLSPSNKVLPDSCPFNKRQIVWWQNWEGFSKSFAGLS